MKYRKLGNTDLMVSEIGFGTWPLSGDANNARSYGKTDDEESKRALIKAFESGVNFFDTSDYYGFGHVESLLGEVFKDKRNEIIISTKVGMVSSDGDIDLSTDHLVKSVEESLKRLNTDYIDVYMLHSPDLSLLEDGNVMSLLEIFKLEGKIRNYGLSLKNIEDGFDAINKYDFEILELNYSITDKRSYHNGLLELCDKNHIGVIARTPLSQGIITGEFTYNEDKTDRRNDIPFEFYHKTRDAYEKMFKCVEDRTQTRAQLALRYCLSNDVISSVIPGMRNESEVLENVKSSTLGKLSENELRDIDEIYREFLI